MKVKTFKGDKKAMSKQNKRYTIRLSNELDSYISNIAKVRGISVTALIKSVLGERKEADELGRKESKNS